MRVGNTRGLAACLLLLLEVTGSAVAEDYGPEAFQSLWQHERKQRRGDAMGGHHHGDDIHGGVPMGVKMQNCDDGVNGIEVDWDPNSMAEWSCDGPIIHPSPAEPTYDEEAVAKPPLHKCLPEKIDYGTPVPMSGSHRPLWPRFGEYTYLPPQRWVHSLEHGAAVFLFHPCADPGEIREFKSLAKSCLYKHVITPSKGLSELQPFAVVTWQHNMNMSHVDKQAVVSFVKATAMRAPEKDVQADGQYEAGLVEASPSLLSYGDAICPDAGEVETLARALRQRVNTLARMYRSYREHSDPSS